MSDLPIILQNLPQNQNTLNRRITQLSPLLAQAQAPIPGAFAQLQLQRVNRGQAPWNLNESARAILAAQRGQAITPEAERSPWSPGAFLSNARHDLGAILSSIPRLPGALVNEVKSLPQLPQAISQAAQAGSVGNVVEALSEAPGIRFVPGAYTVGNLAGGDVSELASHPLFTALDVLPAAGGAAGRFTRVGQKAVEEAALNATRPRALKALATRALNEEGQLVPNIVGRGVNRAMDTRVGQVVSQAFGQDIRAQMAAKAFHEEGIGEAFNPRIESRDPLHLAAKEATRIMQEAVDNKLISPERWGEIDTLLQTDRTAARATATAQELPYINRLIDVSDELGGVKLSEDLLMRFGDESYSWAEGNAIIKAQNRADRTRTAAIDAAYRLEDLQEKVVQAEGVADPRIALIIEHLQAGDYGFASKEMSNLMRRRTAVQAPAKTGAKAGPKSNIQLASLKNIAFDIRAAYGAAKKLEYLEQRAIPARFIPLVLEKEVIPRINTTMRAKYKAMADSGAITVPQSEAMIDQMVDALGRKYVDDVPEFTATEYDAILRDAAKTWKEYKAQGYDPVYIHHVSPDKAFRELKFPRIRTGKYTPTSVKQRMMDFTPSVTNPVVAISHEVTELLLQRATTDWLDVLENGYAKSLDDVKAEFYNTAMRRYERDPSVPFTTHLNSLIKKKYVKWERDKWNREFSGKPLTGTESIRAAGKETPEVWIPRNLERNLERIKPYDTNAISSLTDPVINAFRTSVLPLSPRWHVNNIVGGAIMLGGQTNPLTVWRHIGEARRLLKDPTAIPTELRRALGSANRDVMELNYLGGRTSRRLWDNIQDYFAKHGRGGEEAVKGVRKAGNRIVQGSFDANVFVDDMYRTMAYLYGKSKGERQGLSVIEAEHAGLELARRTLQQWGEITPIERSILKSVIPFYGFMQHILRYTMKYPHDHPVRTAILGSTARAELDDLGSGLPQSYLDFITFGRKDENGNQLGLSTRGLNPFSDVADMFTLQGWMGASNPILSTLFQQSGIDPITGQAELYPDLKYDPSTGQFTIESGNFPMRLVNNIIPQTRVLSELVGASNEFRELMQANPESARRLLQSQLGIPVNVRNFNTPQELMKQEVRRYQEQQKAFNDALSTGNYQYAAEHIALGPRIDQLRQLQSSGVLGAFTPERQNLSFPELLSPIPRQPGA